MNSRHTTTPPAIPAARPRTWRLSAALRAATLCAAVGAALSAPSARASELLALGTSSTGSVAYTIGSGFAAAVNQGQSAVNVSAQSSAGFLENTVLVSEKSIPLGMTEAATLVKAYKGLGPFKGKADKFQKLRWITGVSDAHWHCVVRESSGITSLKGIKGHTFNLNSRSTTTRDINNGLVAALGLTPADFKVVELATKEVFDAIRNRVIDGSCNSFTRGQAEIAELAMTTPVRFLPVPMDTFQKLNSDFGGAFSPYVIPAKTYTGQDSDILTFSTALAIIGHADMSEDQVYAITKAFWDGIDTLRKDPKFADLRFEAPLAMGSGVVPVHPGALRYYKQKLLGK